MPELGVSPGVSLEAGDQELGPVDDEGPGGDEQRGEGERRVHQVVVQVHAAAGVITLMSAPGVSGASLLSQIICSPINTADCHQACRPGDGTFARLLLTPASQNGCFHISHSCLSSQTLSLQYQVS